MRIKKNLFLVISFITITTGLYAQNWSGSGTNTGYIYRLGTVSIGGNYSTSTSALHLYSASANTHLSISGAGPAIKFNEFASNINGDRASIGLATSTFHYLAAANPYDFIIRNNTAGANIMFGTFNTKSSLLEKMRITGNGFIGINTTSPTSVLHVKGAPNIDDPGNGQPWDNDYSLAKFQVSSGGYINIGKSNANNDLMSISAIGASGLNMPLLLNSNSTDIGYPKTSYGGGNVGVGNFILAQNQISTPQSLLHVNYGEFQISSSAAPTLSRTGLLMGSTQTLTTTSSTAYSWVQSSSGPLLLNPLSGNAMTNPTQSNNYVAIGLDKASIPASVPASYNLLVGGKIMCEELKIRLLATWYDHVFASDYKLMPLDSLENYITQNSHLPDIPSAADVQENGIMAGEMSGLLLKKVEELTLYAIEQNKTNTLQAEQIELLKKQNELQAQQLQVLLKIQNQSAK